MLVDEYDQYPNEKTTDVVISSPGSDEPTPPSAADRMFLSNPPSPSIGTTSERESQAQSKPQSQPLPRPLDSCRDAIGGLSSRPSSPLHDRPTCCNYAQNPKNVADPSSPGPLDEAMMARVLPKNPDHETVEEVYNTWHIRDWRKLEKKIHGPVFKSGGTPW
jgi:hypothetical protein